MIPNCNRNDCDNSSSNLFNRMATLAVDASYVTLVAAAIKVLMT